MSRGARSRSAATPIAGKSSGSTGHPNGVEPWGNFYFGGGHDIRTPGLGLLSRLSDELLLGVLGHLPAQSLVRAAAASKALYCFCSHEELWRALTLQEFEGGFRFSSTWQRTYLLAAQVVSDHQHHRQPLRVQGCHSDLLYQPWFCATTPLRPEWLGRDTLERRAGLSVPDFQRLYERPNRPVVLTDMAQHWPAMEKWSRSYLRRAFKGQEVVVGNSPMAFNDYLAYLDGATADDAPLYLFDSAFARKAPQLAADYTVPEHFSEDLFAVLGEDARPDYRWLIMGPARSGSTFHKDPNATSAWNAVVRGAKKWLLFPPHVVPPGVHASADGANVATPVSLVEWFLNFYEEACQGDVRPVEGVVRAGEVLFVPRGWWHMAINLEESVAVTHNYVSGAGLAAALAFLGTRSADLVSGCEGAGARTGLHARFLAALQQRRPEVLKGALAGPGKAAKAKGLASLFSEQGLPCSASTRKRKCVDSADSAEKGVAAPETDKKISNGFRFDFAAM